MIDEDDYGRKLFRLDSQREGFFNVFSDYTIADSPNTRVIAFLICQKYANGNVYYYRDQCYIYSALPELESDKKQIFKAKNDWNKPFNEKLCTKVSDDLSNTYKVHLHNYEEKVIAGLEDALGCVIDKYYIDMIFLTETKPIIIIRSVISWETFPKTFGSSYVVYYNEADEEFAFSELTDSIDTWPEQIASFKKPYY